LGDWILAYYIGSDHAGFKLKNGLRVSLEKDYDFTDLGVFVAERVDYPDIAIKLAKRVASEKGAMGVLVCGSGIGMSMVANKVPGVRAALIYDGFTAKLSRQHNNANIACFGERNITGRTALELVKTFLETEFLGKEKEGERHLQRVKKIDRALE
jgi:ribose 5-phosphate isomerase B